MKTLADLKREIAKPGAALTITECFDPNTGAQVSHRYAGITRKVVRAQSQKACLAHPESGAQSWLDFDKASEWKFEGNTATFQDNWIKIVYRVESLDN